MSYTDRGAGGPENRKRSRSQLRDDSAGGDAGAPSRGGPSDPLPTPVVQPGWPHFPQPPRRAAPRAAFSGESIDRPLTAREAAAVRRSVTGPASAAGPPGSGRYRPSGLLRAVDDPQPQRSGPQTEASRAAAAWAAACRESDPAGLRRGRDLDPQGRSSPGEADAQPSSRREARARQEPTTGSILRRALAPRLPQTLSGGLAMTFERIHGRGLAITGPLELSAPAQRLRALLGQWSGDFRSRGDRLGIDDRSFTDPGGPGALDRQARRELSRSLDAVSGSACRDRGTAEIGQARRDGGGAAPRRARRSAESAMLPPPSSGGFPTLDRPPAAGRTGASVQARIERSRRKDRPGVEVENTVHVENAVHFENSVDVDDDAPADDRRRQLVTSVLALGGLGLTGFVTAQMSKGSTRPPVTTATSDAPPGAASGATPGAASAGASRAASGAAARPGGAAGARHSSVILGYGELDGQHERVLDLVDALENAMGAGGRRKQSLVLGDLVAWLKVHFSFEESLMDNYQLPGGPTHTAHHRAFLTQVEGFKATFEAGTAEVTPALIAMLRTWLKDHVSQDDLRLVKDLKVRGVPSAI